MALNFLSSLFSWSIFSILIELFVSENFKVILNFRFDSWLLASITGILDYRTMSILTGKWQLSPDECFEFKGRDGMEGSDVISFRPEQNDDKEFIELSSSMFCSSIPFSFINFGSGLILDTIYMLLLTISVLSTSTM